MSQKKILGGVVHETPADLKQALLSNSKALEAWEDIMPLARNEWICWIESAKNRKPGQSESNGDAKIWKREKDAPVAGPVVSIVELMLHGSL